LIIFIGSCRDGAPDLLPMKQVSQECGIEVQWAEGREA